MNKSITKNYLYNVAYQILAMVIPLITTPYISRVLGAENIGIYSYTLSISAFFILFGSLGIALYGQREIAYVQNDKKKYSYTFWEILILRCITMTISLIIFYFTFAVGNNEYNLYYKILLLELIGNMIDISWFFQGLEEFKKTVLRNTLVKLISLALIFILVKTKNDLPIYFVIYVLSVILGNLSLWFYLPKYLAKIKFSELKIFRHLKPTIELFIPQIATQVYTVLDRTMIGTIISDKSEVGYYEQANKIVRMLLTVITSLGTVMLPRIASTYAKGEEDKVNEYMKESFDLVFMLAFPLIFGVISASDAFVPFFFGDGYEKVAVLMKVISPIVLLVGLGSEIGIQYLLPTKRQKEYTISVISGAIVNFIMNICLIRNYGAIGASIGTVVAELTVTLVQIYFVKEDFDFKEIFKDAKNYCISSLIMFCICLFIGGFIKNNLVSIIVQVGVGMLTYVILLLVLKDKFIIEMINKFIKIGGKNGTN